MEILLSHKVRLGAAPAHAAESKLPEPAPSETTWFPPMSSDGKEITGPVTPPFTPAEPPVPAPGEGQGEEKKDGTIEMMSSGGEDPTLGGMGSQAALPESFLFTGAATYRIPIEVPPGRGGIAPQIALTYNSYQGSSWVGVGWNLDLGSIQRSTKRGVVYSEDDYVATVNGGTAELVPWTAAGQGCFRSFIEGTYTKYCKSGDGWVVTTKDGTKYFYGTSSGSRQANGTNIFRWYLDRVEDTKTNYMEISYTQDQGEVYLSQINYTGNVQGGLSPTHQVNFLLENENRTDIAWMYTTNYLTKMAKRLKTIEVKGNGDFQRKYVLDYGAYSPSSSRSVLRSVTQYGKDGQSVLYRTFGWQQGGTTGTFALTSTTTEASVDQFTGDVNGDGKADLMAVIHNGGFQTAFLRTAISNGDGTFVYHSQEVAMWEPTICYWFSGDANGDGKSDFMGVCKLGSWVALYTALSNGDGTFQSLTQTTNWGWDYRHRFFIGDVNGDGKADFMLAALHGPHDSIGYYHACLHTALSNITGTTGSYTQTGQDTDWGWDNAHVWMPGDINGDGLTDFMLAAIHGPHGGTTYNHVSFHAAVSLGNGSFNTTISQDTALMWDYYQQFMPGDVNGDGKTDFLRASNSYNYYHFSVGLSDGNGHFEILSQLTSIPASSRIFPGDVNGDGKTDFMIVHDFGYPGLILSTALSKGDGTYAYTTYQTSWPAYTWIDENQVYAQIMPGDVNGDGKTDFLHCLGDSGFRVRTGLSQGPLDLMVSATNILGGTSSITYKPSSAYANSKLPFIMQTASEITNSDGRGNSYTTKYAYEGGYFVFPNREFWGFNKAWVYKWNGVENETWTETHFIQDWVRKGLIGFQAVNSREGHLRTVVNGWSVSDPLPGGAYFPYLLQSNTVVTDYGATAYAYQSRFVYDGYFNVKEEPKNENISAETVRTYYDYWTGGQSAWIFSKPERITVKDYDQLMVSRKWLTYTASGNPATEQVCKATFPIGTQCETPNSSQNPEIGYEYYSNGNLWKITDARGFKTEINYDSATKTHVYETKKCLDTSCANYHLTTTNYDLGTGNLTSVIPPHLQGTAYSVSYLYDTFGRKTKESRPDGGWTEYGYGNWGNPNGQFIQKTEYVKALTASEDGYFLSQSYIDGLGRTFWVSSRGYGSDWSPDGEWIVATTSFDTMGRVQSKSIPYYFGIDTPYYTSYTYDGLSRVTDVLLPDGNHILTTYWGLEKRVTNQKGENHHL